MSKLLLDRVRLENLDHRKRAAVLVLRGQLAEIRQVKQEKAGA